jgi:uncharacterized membrane protein YhaH (DUF805 family)
MSWFFRVLKKYAVFSGRASRREFWMYHLIQFIIVGVLLSFYLLTFFLPTIAVWVRRMHDTGRSGWWGLIPGVNIKRAFEESQPGANRFGPNPNDSALYNRLPEQLRQFTTRIER